MASTRTSTKTKVELKAEEAAAKKARAQAAALKKAEPSKAELDARSKRDTDAAAKSQPKDDKQAPTMGIVARGHMVKNEGEYKGPGRIVKASKGEIETMRARGVLVDEGRVALPLANQGPQVLIEDERSRGIPEPR